MSRPPNKIYKKETEEIFICKIKANSIFAVILNIGLAFYFKTHLVVLFRQIVFGLLPLFLLLHTSSSIVGAPALIPMEDRRKVGMDWAQSDCEDLKGLFDFGDDGVFDMDVGSSPLQDEQQVPATVAAPMPPPQSAFGFFMLKKRYSRAPKVPSAVYVSPSRTREEVFITIASKICDVANVGDQEGMIELVNTHFMKETAFTSAALTAVGRGHISKFFVGLMESYPDAIFSNCRTHVDRSGNILFKIRVCGTLVQNEEVSNDVLFAPMTRMIMEGARRLCSSKEDKRKIKSVELGANVTKTGLVKVDVLVNGKIGFPKAGQSSDDRANKIELLWDISDLQTA